MVALPYARLQPRTMMVIFADTFSTILTVLGPHWLLRRPKSLREAIKILTDGLVAVSVGPDHLLLTAELFPNFFKTPELML